MIMTRNEVIEIVIEKLTEIQEIGEREFVPINKNTVPIGGLPGFDSLNGIEFAAIVDERLNIGEVDNICASKDNTRALSVAEIASRILELISKQQE
jgi:hypothetical protein